MTFAAWPYHVPARFASSTLAVLVDRGTRLLTEDGGDFWVPGWGELRDVICARELLVFTDPLQDFPYLAEVASDRWADLTGSKSSAGRDTLRVRVRRQSPGRRGRRVFWICPTSDWFHESPSLEFLHELRAIFDHAGAGTQKSPGFLGQALQLQTWRDHNTLHLFKTGQLVDSDWPAAELPERYAVPKYRHAAPCRASSRDMRRGPGARVQDVSSQGATWRVDISSAYPRHFDKLPSGSTCRFSAPCDPEHFPAAHTTYYAAAEVTIHEKRPLYPFAVRGEGGALSYPTEPGTYRTHLWMEQVQDCQAAGCTVRLLEGWYWRRWSTDTADWCRLMLELRRTAPTAAIERAMKQAANQAIGFHGGASVGYEIVPETGARAGDAPMCGAEGLIGLYMRQSRARRAGMVHWYCYTVMSCARSLYRLALPYAESGRLVTMHTDGVRIAGDPLPEHLGDASLTVEHLMDTAKGGTIELIASLVNPSLTVDRRRFAQCPAVFCLLTMARGRDLPGPEKRSRVNTVGGEHEIHPKGGKNDRSRTGAGTRGTGRAHNRAHQHMEGVTGGGADNGAAQAQAELLPRTVDGDAFGDRPGRGGDNAGGRGQGAGVPLPPIGADRDDEKSTGSGGGTSPTGHVRGGAGRAVYSGVPLAELVDLAFSRVGSVPPKGERP